MDFFSNIQEYLEKQPSLQCIPVHDKAPVIAGWQSIDVTPDLIQLWEDEGIRHNGFGIRSGQDLGEGFRLGFVDYDTDDNIMISKVDELLDISNICSKRGKKGKTVFFKYKGNPEKGKTNYYTKSDKKRPVIEVFLHTGQTVLPPSMHPESGIPYKWLSLSLLDIDIEDLPELNLEKLQYLEAVINAPSFQEAIKILPTQVTGEGSGKFNTMTKLCTSLIMQGFDDASIAKTLIHKDREMFPGNQFFHSAKVGDSKVLNDDIRTAFNWVTKYRLSIMKDPKIANRLINMSKGIEVRDSNDESWLEPQLLETMKDTRVIHFDNELFPPIMKDYCIKSAEASNLPPEAFLMGLMTTFSTVVQKKILINVKSDFQIYPSLSSIVVAPSGSRKDSVFDSCMAPLRKLIRRDRDNLGTDFIEIEKTVIGKIQDLTSKKKKAIAEGDEDAIKEFSRQIIIQQDELISHKEKSPDFIFESGTQERAFKMINASKERGLMFLSSEYVGFMGTLNKLGNDGLRAFFLKSINGSPSEMFSHATISGTNVNASEFSGNAFMGVQLDVFANEFRKIESGVSNDGLLQRFMIIPVSPEIQRMKIHDKLSCPELDNKFALWYDHKDQVEMILEPDALEAYIEFDYMIREKSKYDISAVKSWKSKYSGKMPVIAALYEQLMQPPGKIAKTITLNSAKMAIELLKLQSAQLDLTLNKAKTGRDLSMAAAILDSMKTAEIHDGSTVSQIRTAVRMRDNSDVTGALQILIEANWIKLSRDGKVTVNPRAY